jgi:hypothetical protein
MATLPAGDTTTQLRIWIDTNAAGADVNTKVRAAAAAANLLPATMEIHPLLKALIAR